MTDILVRPKNLKTTASELRSSAVKILTALKAVDQIIRSLEPVKFEGIRATLFRSRYQSLSDKLFNSPQVIQRFADDLVKAAIIFEKYDKSDSNPIHVSLPVNPTIDPGVFQPKSPFEKYYVTAKYGKYGPDAGKYAGKTHNGLDIKPTDLDKNGNNPVFPIGPGIIKKIGWDPKGYGNYVIIEHTLQDGTKVFSLYAHLSDPPKLIEGELIGNTFIGNMGSTGKSTGPHLHLEIWKLDDKGQKIHIDPEKIINGDTDWEFKGS